MNTFDDYLNSLTDQDQVTTLKDLFQAIDQEFPNLQKRIAWSSPTYTNHGTHIISFKAYKNHLAASIEGTGIRQFAEEFDRRGIKYGKMNVNFPWSQPLNLDLIFRMIQFNIDDKQDCTTFWRS